MLQALRPGPGDRELDGQRVPRVLQMLDVEVGGLAVGVLAGLVRADPGVGP